MGEGRKGEQQLHKFCNSRCPVNIFLNAQKVVSDCLIHVFIRSVNQLSSKYESVPSVRTVPTVLIPIMTENRKWSITVSWGGEKHLLFSHQHELQRKNPPPPKLFGLTVFEVLQWQLFTQILCSYQTNYDKTELRSWCD